MPSEQNKVPIQGAVQSTHNPKSSPTPTTSGNIKNDVIPPKDKSPDDLEILD